MKDVLAHLQKSMQRDLENRSDGIASNLAPQQLPDQNSNEMTLNGHFQNNRSTWTTSFQSTKSKYSDGPLMNFLSEYKPSYEVIQTMLQELHNERVKILNEIDSEEKERLWYMNQVEKLKQQQHTLPLKDNYTAENEGASRELEQEACRLRETMQQKFGSNNDVLHRYEVRAQNLQLIDKEINKLREQTQRFVNIRNNVESGESESKENVNCISPMSNRSSNMTTSATQTTIELFPADCASSNGHANGDNNLSAFGTWPLEKAALWHSGPSTIGEMNSSLLALTNQETSSVMSFTSSMNSSCSARRAHTHQLGTKVEVVYSLLSLLGSHDKEDMSKRLLAMSSSQDSCVAMRQSGCMPLLIQLLYGGEKDSSGNDSISNREVRMRASKALHNIVHAHPDDKRGRREARVLRLLEQIRDYCDSLQDNADLSCDEEHNASSENTMEQHPGPAMAALMKLSFDEEHRHAMCQLGGLQAIAELIEVDYAVHGNTNDQYCVTSRRYAGMALTNLTFGDGTNKALLCSFKSFMRALVAQLHSPSEDLRQVVSSVLRNLSWRADVASKKNLREVGAVTTLMKAAMEAKKESTLKSILSALWNLSAHCSANKSDICAVDGALEFLVSTLTYKSTSRTLAIIENGGGILRNISSQIALREDYREVLRQHQCLQVLLQHLRSSSLTIVSNACGTLWNLSARCVKDQQTLWEMGAVSMLRNLVHSKHKMIAMGSSAALKNLLAAKPQGMAMAIPGTIDGQKSNVPSLLVRKQRALEAEIDQNLAETCDNIDSPKSSPTHRIDSRYVLPENVHHHNRLYNSVESTGLRYVSQSGNKDTTHSDLVLSQSENGEFMIHKVADESQCSGWQQESTDGFYNNLGKAGLTSQESSRIAQVMKEVVRQVALEDSLSTNLERKFTGPNGDKNLLSYNSFMATQHGPDANSSDGRSHNIYDKYSDFSNKLGSRNSNEFSAQEEREKYNSKYTDNDLGDGFSPKVDNCDKKRVDKTQPEVTNKQTNRQWQGINEISLKQDGDETKHYSAYAENDLESLDQPTNYSLRYHEENDETDHFRPPAPKPAYYPNTFPDKKPSVHDDTMTTYCMEGTPLNFSNATSLSDLREMREKSPLEKNPKSECGFSTEEKPVSYCVEGTPVCFSRVSSLSSLHSGDKEIEIGEVDLKDDCPEKCIGDKQTTVRNECKEIKEVKSVSFGDGNVAEETPLMFSRCSSLGSLSSFDQNSIHDDRSSVVSDFSRRASGALSPSDLPDSPSQTMPCSPKRIKDNIDFPSKSSTDVKESNSDPFAADTIRAYATEDTPNGFSTATSLSSLPIYDDTADKLNDMRQKMNNENSYDESQELNSQDESAENKQMSESEENEDEMLAACIRSGMPNNSKHNNRKYNNSKLLSKVNKLSGIPRARTSGIPVKANNVRPTRPPMNAAAASLSPPTSTCKQINDSKDNLISKGDYYRAGDGDCEKSDDVLLAECIQSGMPKNKSQRNKSDDLLLIECIQSGMPKNRVQRNNISADPGSGGDKINNPSRVIQKQRPPTVVNRNVQVKNANGFGTYSSDEVKIYAEEGTPKNISGFSSLSDLTVDSIGEGAKGKLNRKIPTKQPVEYLDAASDSLHNYAEEGTPGIISRQDSFSSLSIIDDESGQERQRAHKDNVLYRISGKYSIGTNSERNHSLPSDEKSVNYQNTSNQRNLIPPRSSTNNSVANGSASGDYDSHYLVEGTPLCFSNNSPLSCLSIDSIGIEPSAEEQALLDKCISSGMPKNKNSTAEKKSRKNQVEGKGNELKKREQLEATDSNGNCEEQKSTVGAENKHDSIDESSKEVISQAPQYRREMKKQETPVCESSHEIIADKYEQISNLSESKVFQMEAGRLAEQIEEQASNLPDSMNQSAASYSELDGVKPPSVMGDLPSINCSMANSCASERSFNSETQGYRNVESVQPQKRSGIPIQKKNVPQVFIRPRTTINDTDMSNCSDVLENVQPPSVMEDMDLISSTYSVASIASEVVEARSGAVSPKGSFTSELLFDAIRPAIAMAEFYAREAAVIGSMKSSCNSEYIENVNPPSMLHDLTECNSTNNDVTAAIGSDTDTDNELPEDDAGGMDRTLVEKSSRQNSVNKSQASDISIDATNKSQASEHSLEITPEVVQALQENANLVVSTLIECKRNAYNEDSSFNDDIFIECETLSLVSNDSDSERSESEMSSAPDIMACRRPRIIKPADIEPHRLDRQDPDKGPKGIRGKRRSLTKPRQKPSSVPPPRSESPRATAVKPTRTSALRTTQTQQKPSPTLIKNVAVNGSVTARKTISNVTPRAVVRGGTNKAPSHEKEENKPKPPVKQGTFTKEKPSEQTAPKISPTKIKQPTVNTGVDRTGNRLRKVQSRSLDDRNAANSSPKMNGVGDSKTNMRRVQTPSPMNRKVSTSMSNLKKGSNVVGMKGSASNQSIGLASQSGRKTPTGNSRSRSGSLNNGSNLSLSSNNSTASSKKTAGSGLVKKQVVSKVAAMWKKNPEEKDVGKTLVKRPSGLPRSSTYEKIPSGVVESETEVVCLKLEDKNQAHNKTFTKSPSMDSKLGSLLHDNKEARIEESKSPVEIVKPFSSGQLMRPKTLNPFSSNDDGKKLETKSSAAAIVAPFNYNPNSARGSHGKSLIPTPTKVHAPPLIKPKDVYEAQVRDEQPKAQPKTNACLITTV